jgi:coenzyme F420-0:L-glutamate ligase / coenzyme F420-1:gamma-L-glutamate ligase
MTGISVLPLEGIPEVRAGDDLAVLLGEAVNRAGGAQPEDVLVVAQKVVSKAEGRVLSLDEVEPTEQARDLAGDHDPRHLQVILSEAARLVRTRAPLVIAETRHGFVCASAGVDRSNAARPDTVVLLPVDPDASARRLSERLGVAVIISDSFGRPFRNGTTDVAIGVAGIAPLQDLRGVRDPVGYELKTTKIAVADEIAGAAELVMGKTAGIPAAIVRGVAASGDGTARELVIPAERDLFR